MSGKFLSRVDLAAAKREMEIFNSMLKRGDVRYPDDILRERYVVCGCGAPGCGFISCDRKQKKNVVIPSKRRTSGQRFDSAHFQINGNAMVSTGVASREGDTSGDRR